MTDEELEKVARAALDAIPRIRGLRWEAIEWPEDTNSECVDCAGATSGVVVHHTEVLTEPVVTGAASSAIAEHISAFNPATALALLERVRKAEARVRELEDQIEDDAYRAMERD